MVALSAVSWLGAGIILALGHRRLRTLGDADALPDDALPSVAIVVAAKDEADRVEQAVRSLLTQDYPAIQVVVVDDRSVDGTGAILDRVAREPAPRESVAREPAPRESVSREPARLRVVHVETLPPGWIGKCYALARASAEIKADWILFTDGDIEFAPDAVRSAVSLALREGVDHLAVAPDMILESLGEAAFIGYFLAMFYLSQQPWRAPDPHSKSSIGIGAFNLVRRTAYERSGGHARIRYELIDDLGLGKILKRSGARQMLALHGGKVRARWHVGVRGLIRGVEKNAFAALRYRMSLTLPAVAFQVAFSLSPVGGFFLPGLAPRVLAAVAWAGVGLVYAVTSRGMRIRPWQAVFMPVGGVLFGYAILRSAMVAVARRGLFWRGTFYPLTELRRELLP